MSLSEYNTQALVRHALVGVGVGLGGEGAPMCKSSPIVDLRQLYRTSCQWALHMQDYLRLSVQAADQVLESDILLP